MGGKGPGVYLSRGFLGANLLLGVLRLPEESVSLLEVETRSRIGAICWGGGLFSGLSLGSVVWLLGVGVMTVSMVWRFIRVVWLGMEMGGWRGWVMFVLGVSMEMS